MWNEKRELYGMEQVANVAEYAGNIMEAVRSSDEYKNYHLLLKKVMQNPEVYDKINAFRKKSFLMSLNEEENSEEEIEEEMGKILNNRTIAEFLRSERSLCQMVRQINYAVVEAADLDVSFL